MVRAIGGDLVGMSTTLEAIAAREAGLEVLGISLVTNQAAGMTGEPLNHAEVLEAGRAAATRMGELTLVAEGFLVARKYVGTFVAELADNEAEDLLAIRALIEPLCAARAAERRTPEQLGRLKELVRLGEESVSAGRLDDLARLNSRFHELMAESSGSATLGWLMWQMSQKIAWVYSAELPRRASDSWAEHAEMCAAIAAQDVRRARRLTEQHIAEATAAYAIRKSAQTD
jgi:DNA-binding GntR family transcriptional regulator